MVHATYLPGNDPERVDVVGLRTFGTNKSEVLRVNHFRDSTTEKPVDIRPRDGGWNGSCTKASNTDASTGIDEDVSLDKRERVARV